MTVLEAKKIIDMCTDIDTMNGKPYVNKEFVLNILEMIDEDYKTQPGVEPIIAPTPTLPPTWPQVWYKNDTDAPDPGPGYEKVPWWVWYKNPLGEFTCDSNSTASKPQDANIVTTSADLTKFNESHTNPEDYKNVTITSDSSV